MRGTKVVCVESISFVFTLDVLEDNNFSASFYRPDSASTATYKILWDDIALVLPPNCSSPEVVDVHMDVILEHLRPKLMRSLTEKNSKPKVVEQAALSFAALPERHEGDAALIRGDGRAALDVFGTLLGKYPQDPVVQLDLARAQLATACNVSESAEGFKRVISLLRRRHRHGVDVNAPVPSSPEGDASSPVEYFTSQQLSHAAYTGLGAAFEAMGRSSRAVTSYVLALKYLRPSGITDHTCKVPIFTPHLLPTSPTSPGDASPSSGLISCPPMPPRTTTDVCENSREVNAELALHSLLSAHNSAVGRKVGDETSSGTAFIPSDHSAALAEIEEALSLHSIKALQDPFQFSCTMCGECCRTSDNIMLTPKDIFDITRSPALELFGISKTNALVSHSYFQSVFHYTRRGGYPVCYLRPIKETDKRGHCQFAYPLYSTDGPPKRTATVSKSQEADASVEYDVYSVEMDLARVDTGAAAAPDTTLENSVPRPPPAHSAGSGKALVPFSDYFEHALSKDMMHDIVMSQEPSSRSCYDADNNEAEASDDDPPDYDSRDSDASSSSSGSSRLHWNGVINSSGRQALGCMLGMHNMPTLCQSYPIAPELSQADFWHVRRVFWRDRLSEMRRGMPSAGSCDMQSPSEVTTSSRCADNRQQSVVSNAAGRRLAPGWQGEENYVVVHAPACEGFKAGDIRDENASLLTYQDLTPVRDGELVPEERTLRERCIDVAAHANDGVESKHPDSYNSSSINGATIGIDIDPAGDNIAGKRVERTVRQFIGDNLLERWEETQWFLALIEDVSTYLPIELLTNKEVTLVFVNRLAQIWYNFDSLQCARTRPFKTYRRLKRDIESLTWTLVKETKNFIQSPLYYSTEDSPVETRYRSLLIRLGIS